MKTEIFIHSEKSSAEILSIVQDIKNAVIQYRYKALRSANAEQLSLYYHIGEYLVNKVDNAEWGDKVLENIASLLQQEIPGQRGFSASNLKKMRRFYVEWNLSLIRHQRTN